MPEQRVSIESVKMRNFLSFYDGTVRFDPGLTVILGPNGSGKTSVFHAIKFALGSNQRENRYGKWSDFIRHGASAGDVELVVRVNGTDKRFVRKIDRDGIPRSYVDGRRVKASELRTEVEALGLEVDNTLIFMPQERINALRDMDPVEVRRLVEEGTGLAALRDRISAQEMEVANDRQRLETAISESQLVGRELELLQHDLDRLQKKRRLQAEEELLSTELKWALIEELAARVEQAKESIERDETGLSSLLEESRQIEESIARAETASSVLEERSGKLQMEIGGIDARLQEEESRLLKVKDESKKSALEIRQLEKDVAAERRKRSKIQDDLRRAAAAKEEHLEAQSKLKEEISGLDEERIEIEKSLEVFADWNQKRADVYGKYRALQAEISAKDVLVRSLNERLQVDEAELHSIESKWGQVWTTLEKMDEKELMKRKSQLENRMASLNEERFGHVTESARLQKETDEIRVRLTESSKRIPDSVRQLKEAVTEHGLKHVQGPVIEMFAQDNEYAAAVEAALSGDLGFSLLVQDSAEFALLEKLRDKLDSVSPVVLVHGDTPLEPLPEVPVGAGVIGWLWDEAGVDEAAREKLRRGFGDFLLTRDRKTASRLSVQRGLRAVSIDGQVVVPQEHSVVSFAAHQQTGIISAAPLHKRLAELEKQVDTTRRKVAQVATELEKTAKEREEVLELLSQMARWSGTWEKRRSLLETIPQMQERVASVDDDIKSLRSEQGESERDLRALDTSQPPERSRLIGQQAALRNKQKRLQNDLARVEASLNASERDESTLRAELKSLDVSIDMLSSRLEELKAEIKGTETETARIVQAVETLKESKKETSSTQLKVKAELASIRASLKSLSERLVEINITARDSHLKVVQAKRQLASMDEEKRRLRIELGESERPKKLRPVAVVREQVARVKHLLDDYQDVNESVAVTEVQLRDRLGSLTANVAQLREELNEAERAVKSIRSQYQDGMNETLAKVESEVNSVLSTVRFAAAVRFELVQSDGQYGVEFRTKIKGEDFMRISAGSGGERSLIAIGLILTLQRFNPAPVYVLDEIDTFLDATNTELVSMLLYDCSRRSQFILFTPAKSTHLLRHADRRIGVVSPGGTEPSVIIESPAFSAQ